MTNGPLMTLAEAANKAGIKRVTLNSYIEKGYLNTHVGGMMVYYRDVLRASWIAYEYHRKNSGKASKNYGKLRKAKSAEA